VAGISRKVVDRMHFAFCGAKTRARVRVQNACYVVQYSPDLRKNLGHMRSEIYLVPTLFCGRIRPRTTLQKRAGTNGEKTKAVKGSEHMATTTYSHDYLDAKSSQDVLRVYQNGAKKKLELISKRGRA
jgi:hypothetical protein